MNRRGASPTHVRASVEHSLTPARHRPHRPLLPPPLRSAHRHRPHAAHARRARHVGQDPAHRGEQLRRLAGRDRARAAARCNGWAPIVALQPMYNLIKRQAEVELLPLAQSADLAVFPYSPLAGGLLTGKYGTTPGSGEGRLVTDKMYSIRYRDEGGFVAAAELAALAAEVGCHPATLAVAWVGEPSGSDRTVDRWSFARTAPTLARRGRFRARRRVARPDQRAHARAAAGDRPQRRVRRRLTMG